MGPIDLAQLIREAVERTRLSTTQHRIAVQVETSEEPIEADRDHLEQVLDNLLSNAIKYSPEGGEIQLRAWDEDDRVVLSVRDQGVGIPSSQLDEVFGLFYQTEDPVSRRTGGMGLGLYISREIIIRHGGRIWVESAAGQGSTFYVSLPRTRVASPRPSNQPETVQSAIKG
jgi:signal transduction histidine kinase